MSSPTYRNLRVARRCWAYYQYEDRRYGFPEGARLRVNFWALTANGETVGLVLSEEGLIDAKEIKGFVRFEQEHNTARARRAAH